MTESPFPPCSLVQWGRDQWAAAQGAASQSRGEQSMASSNSPFVRAAPRIGLGVATGLGNFPTQHPNAPHAPCFVLADTFTTLPRTGPHAAHACSIAHPILHTFSLPPCFITAANCPFLRCMAPCSTSHVLSFGDTKLKPPASPLPSLSSMCLPWRTCWSHPNFCILLFLPPHFSSPHCPALNSFCCA